MRYAGINIPVFSLRTKKGLGTGEFLDLIPLIDWCKEAGLKVIQILPVHDTSITETKSDSSPYTILSTFSLHPIYLNILALAPELEEEVKPIAKIVNQPHLDYLRTYLAKIELLKMLYLLRGKEDLSSKAFERFFKKNQSHLKAYAAFSILKEQFRTSDFRRWGADYAHYSELLVDEICEREEAKFFYFVQFHLHQQLKEVVHYAKEQGILLKGDLPIGIHPHSVDAWRFADYFAFEKTMGAPPGLENSVGQNWGFPTYKWDEIKAEGFYWLKARLEWLEQYFSIIRLDHVLGYFRFWEIPIEEVRGIMGNFYPAQGFSKEELEAAGITVLQKKFETQKQVRARVKDETERNRLYALIEDRLFFYREGSYHPRIDIIHTNSFQALDKNTQKKVIELREHYYLDRNEEIWRKGGMEKLRFIKKNTSLFLCGENMGVNPACIEETLEELNILHLCTERIPKSFEKTFEHSQEFTEMSVCTPSNHDMAPLRAWWEEDEEKTALYYHTILKRTGQPPKTLTAELAYQIIQDFLKSKSKMAIFLLQDLLAINDALKFPDPKWERINDPANTNNQWNWRSHIYIEEFLLAKSFSKQIREMVKAAKR